VGDHVGILGTELISIFFNFWLWWWGGNFGGGGGGGVVFGGLSGLHGNQIL
jgi:hypothetical protein